MLKLSDSELALYVKERYQQLSNDASSWKTLWQDIGNYVMPRKAEIISTSSEPNTDRDNQLFDSTAIRANMVLANGQLSWMTPLESRWFSYDPPAHLKGVDSVEQYYRQCSEITQMHLARSNFYSEIHEFYLDRGAFGTASLYVEEGKKSLLNFQKFDIGTFYIAEDDEGYVDTLYREFELTPRQARMWFGYDNLSEKIQKALDDKSGKSAGKKFKFLHAIFPRQPEDIEIGKRDGANKPIASVYMEVDGNKIVKVGGYDEQPFFTSRYLKWTSMPYGWCPSWMALPDARQLNFLQKLMDALCEIQVNPRILAPDNIDEIDYRASGVTYYDSAQPNAVPKEWASVGRYDIGNDRVIEKQKAINDAFHVDLFQMFAQLQKQMTAREVAERSAEKLIQFSPTFARMTTEMFNPMLQRIYAILSRAGVFPQPPPEAIEVDQAGEAFLPEPSVSYSSRIALAIKSLENNSFMRTMESMMPLIQARPDILDNWDLDEISRDISRNEGMPARWLIDAKQRDEIRNQRAQQQAQMAQAQQAEQMAGAAAKAGSIKPDSMVGQMMQQAA